MVAKLNPDPKPQVMPKPAPELDFIESPFDRWLRLADDIIEKHKPAEKTDRLAS